MRSGLVAVLVVLASISTVAQRKFTKGYFVKTSGERTEAEIMLKSMDRRDCPKGFEYRASAKEQAVEADVTQIKELGLSDGSIFRQFTVNMDRSSDNVNRLNTERNPEFKSETLFLRLLVDGKAMLYVYDEGNLHRFFFSLDGAPLEQLVYKRYNIPPPEAPVPLGVNSPREVGTNENFKQQILNALKCKDIGMKEIERLDYKQKPLTKIFVTFNKCIGSPRNEQ
jgi:hypothetical protein